MLYPDLTRGETNADANFELLGCYFIPTQPTMQNFYRPNMEHFGPMSEQVNLVSIIAAKQET